MAGAEDCETTVIMSNVNNSVVYVPSATVCFKCSGIKVIFGFDVEFIISEEVNRTSYTVAEESGDIVLLVTDSEKAFSTSLPETVKCCEVHEGKCFVNNPNPHIIKVLRYYSKCSRHQCAEETL